MPDPARLSEVAGTYHDDDLGIVVLEVSRAGTTFDAGEWRSAMGRRTRDPATLTLVFLDPPFAGTEITVGGDQSNPTLVIPYGEKTYVFARRQTGSKRSSRRRR